MLHPSSHALRAGKNATTPLDLFAIRLEPRVRIQDTGWKLRRK
jgi:hypothetical protein